MHATIARTWRRVGTQQHEQEYGFMEKVYRRVSVPAGQAGRFLLGTHVQFHTTRQGGVDELAAAFRRAWIQIRHECPDIACLPAKRGKTYTSLDTPGELETWVSRTFVVIHDRSALDLWQGLTKTNQVTLYYLTKTNHLFLQTEHYHLDGRGMLRFWNLFFTALITPAEPRLDGSEVGRLQPRPLDIVDLHGISDESAGRLADEIMQPLAARTAARIKMPNASSLTPAGGGGRGGRPPAGNSYEETKLGAGLSEAIVASCKGRKLSITGVWHAALVFATRDEQLAANEGVGSTYVGLANFDLRTHYPDGGEKAKAKARAAAAYPFGDHHCVLPMALAIEGKDISDAASELTNFYWHRLADSKPDIWAALPVIAEKLTPALTTERPTDSTPSAASLGLVDSYIDHSYGGEWTINDFWAGNTVAGPSIKCFIYTWKGRLILNSCYNSDCYSRETLSRFHARIVQWILRALDLMWEEYV
ncbi:putative NAD-dependent 15-hydroxyprostaglandin dehydrogenase protein [Rosellinia necatrix]|uniref:Putative NAD-dependent 15-hydroxyprostaglandin dehydrogenase protein n=1 Tax=Rosellinia necatrix TaxID=77044 RepID=A0A1W2TQF4_ROSNE|nr:putative NAD-dependent 15-hydroxyprostaglandin dehydrogenase protein [Rosellinia necatrix]